MGYLSIEDDEKNMHDDNRVPTADAGTRMGGDKRYAPAPTQ